MMLPDIRKFFAPKAAPFERRLHRRALQYWLTALGDEETVRLEDFDPLAIEDQQSHGFMLDLTRPADPVFTYVGPVLEQEAGLDEEGNDGGVPFAAVPGSSLLMRFASHYERVLASGAPETAEYDFVTEAGYHVLCRGALLPLSSDGERIDHVYGVVSWKSEKVASAA